MDLHQGEDGADPINVPPTGDIEDIESAFASVCSSVASSKTVVFQGTHRIQRSDSLFYTTVTAAGVPLKAMMDSGSTGCTLSVPAVQRLLQQNPDMRQYSADDVIIIGCGGHQVTPSATCDVEVEVYDCKMFIPMFVVPGQTDDMILGSNAIKTIIRLMRKTDGYWRLMSEPSSVSDEDCHHFFSLLSNTERWRGDTVPEKVGTLKLQRCVTLRPQSEHLVWGMLPASAPMSVGSTVIVEPTQARCRPRQVLVGRIVTPMWGDRCLPMKIINPTNEPIVLKRNTKLADVYPCVAAEDLSQPDHIQVHSQSMAGAATPRSKEDVRRALDELGLSDLDLDLCAVSDLWRDRLLQIIERHESIFSQHKMDCGEATDFVHKIHLVDEKPFRLPYRRVPPSHYEKLRTALNEMEEKGIIRKSSSEYASPLVLVWKKNGDLRICTSGFYNVPMHEDHKKYTAFSSPFGLHEYNRMPQGLSNSPATFMRMMLSIFGDENFTSLLCYLDDLLVFGPNEQIALERLEMGFSRLKNHNLKLAPKKCHFLRRSVKFLGHVISESGVQTDPGKVEAINQVQVSDLMDSDGVTPSQKKIRSFLGMMLYYQHFVEDCSTKARPLFKLLSEQKIGGKARRKRMHVNKRSNQVKLSEDDWTSECQDAFDTLKRDLSHSVTLAHPDFEKPFILAVDASFDGYGAVLSQLQKGEKVARPVAFASRTLSKSQLNYPAHRLEFLALKWAICDKFSHWLKGRHFTAWSDNNPLTYILTKPRLDACEQRWVAKLAAYDFDLKYVPGPKNTVADALSREPFVRSSVSHHLVKESYLSLLNEINGVVTGTVQDAFRLTTNCQAVQTADDSTDVDLSPAQDTCTLSGGAIGAEEVSAVLDVHRTGGVSHLSGASPSSLQLPDEDPSCSLLYPSL